MGSEKLDDEREQLWGLAEHFLACRRVTVQLVIRYRPLEYFFKHRRLVQVSAYLPGYPTADKITLHRLLSHTSGIPNYTASAAFEAASLWPTTPRASVRGFSALPRVPYDQPTVGPEPELQKPKPKKLFEVIKTVLLSGVEAALPQE